MPSGSVTPAGGAAFNGGTITQELVIDTGAGTGQALEVQGSRTSEHDIFRVDYPHTVMVVDSDGVASMTSDDAMDFTIQGTGATEGTLHVRGNSGDYVLSSVYGLASGPGGFGTAGIPVAPGFRTRTITAGALPTKAFVSGTAAQILTARDVFLVIPFTGDATNNAATLKIELSPDNATFSTLDTLSIAAALNLTGALNVPTTIWVPAGWYVKLTATNGTIGTTTYY